MAGGFFEVQSGDALLLPGPCRFSTAVRLGMAKVVIKINVFGCHSGHVNRF